MKNKSLTDDLLDVTDAAEYIGCSVNTLAQWRHEQKGPPYVKFGRIYYSPDEIDEWFNSKKRNT